MTKRERVRASIHSRGGGALPWQFDLTEALAARLARFYGADDPHAAMGDHLVFLSPRDSPAAGMDAGDPGPDCYVSEFGSVWRRSAPDRTIGDWGGLVRYPLAGPDLRGYAFPDGSRPGRWDGAEECRRRHPEHFIVAGGYGLFEIAWGLCGFENYLAYLASEPAFVERLTRHLADFSCAATALLKGRDIDAIRFGDDWGFQDRLMACPDLWRRLYKESYRRIFDAARAVDLTVAVHSCGNITDILPDLIEVGVEVVHPLQPEAMDVEFCQREYGRDVTFWGGLGSQSTLPHGSVDDVRQEVRHRLRLFRSGGYIAAPAGAAPAEVPLRNMAAIVEEMQSQLEG